MGDFMNYNSISDIDLKEIIEKEIGTKFNKQNKIMCPFHPDKTPSLSVKFNSNSNKDIFKCFGCNESGDAIDFIMKHRNMDYMKAREYLGLSINKSAVELLQDKVKNYIEWQIQKSDFRKGNELLGLFQFVDSNNNTLYFKAKFLKPDGSKELSYYHIENDRVINKRGSDEVPYNLHRVIQAIQDNKVIIICEGEKDANTLNSIFKGYRYVATSLKGVKDYSSLYGASIHLCGDTGEAGRKYISEIKEQLFEKSKAFKIINLPGIEELGENKDVTDWIEQEHGKKDLFEAFKRSLDLKNEYELQQDWEGIYKTREGKKIHLTNFKIISASNVKFVEENKEGVEITVQSSLGATVTRSAEISVFDDVRSFKNFLCSFDLVFKGNSNDLMDLKIWIRKYFVLRDEKIHLGARFVINDDETYIVTHEGALKKGIVDKYTKADGGAKINVLKVKDITKEELQELRRHLFNFALLEKTYSIIGTIVNNLTVAHATRSGIKLHHLLIVGESGCGKTTIVSNVIAPILNYPKDDMKSIGKISGFALIKVLSEGNYPIIFEEHKPSRMKDIHIAMLSEVLRNSYDRHSVDRGNKSLMNKTFQLTRPVIIAGEERYANNEKALYERSCIVYLSKNLRTEKHTQSMEWMLANEIILNKLGRSITEQILSLSVKEYEEIRKKVASRIKGLKDRPLCTAINICTGIEILNKVFSSFKIEKISNYEELVAKNIIDEIVDIKNNNRTEVEEVLVFYNEMIEDGRTKSVVKIVDEVVCIRTSEMFNQVHFHIKSTGLKKQVIELSEFKKQALLSGYIVKLSGKVLSFKSKSTKFDIYNSDKLKKLGVDEIVPPNLKEEAWEEGEQQKIYKEGNAT